MTFFFPAKSLSLNFSDPWVLGSSKSGALSPTSSAVARPGRNARGKASTIAWMKPNLFMNPPLLAKWIGFLNDLFYGRSYIAAPAELSIPFLLDEKSTVVPVRLAGEQSGGKRNVSYGLHWQTVLIAQIVWNRSTRRAGARGGAWFGRPRWVRILSITGGSSIAAMIFKCAVTIWAVLDIEQCSRNKDLIAPRLYSLRARS